MYFIVYETTNLVNGKRYRGAHAAETLDDGYLGSGRAMAAAISRYGRSNFRRDILEICSSLEAMYYAESKWINSDWLSLGKSKIYNLVEGGKGGTRPCSETLLLRSKALKGRVVSEVARQRLSAAHKGRKASAETCAKLSAIRKGRRLSEQHRKRIGEAHRGMRRTPETCLKIAERAKGRVMPDSVRAEVSRRFRGRPLTEEHRRKISAAHKGKVLDQNALDKLAAARAARKFPWNKAQTKPQQETQK